MEGGCPLAKTCGLCRGPFALTGEQESWVADLARLLGPKDTARRFRRSPQW